MRRISHDILIGITFSLASSSALAVDTNTSLRIERVALFKNGLGYATATMTLPAEAKSVRLGQLPVPAYGTFWVGYGKGVALRSLTTAMETVDELVPVSGVEEMLRLNPGSRVVLHVGGNELVSGVVQPLPLRRAEFEPPSPYFMDFRRSPDRPYYSGYPPPGSPGIVLVKTDHGLVALSPGAVQRADFDGEPICLTTNREKRPSIQIELEQPAGGTKIGVSYLARGITWVPSYLVDLSDERTARLSAQAQIINEMADLESVQVELVTGFPNIQFPEVPNPVAMSQALAEFLKALAAGRAEPNDQNFMTQQRALALNSVSYVTAPLPTYSTVSTGQAAEDLFLYPVPKLSLKRGETATIPLFTAEMPYRHLYSWKVADQVDGERPRPAGDGRSAEEVWHICRLLNTARMPLTTAAAEFVKDGQFVGQDTCFYTVAGAEGSIRVNRAMNVQAEQAEMEVERKRNAANFYGWSYDLVKVTGELKIGNRLGKPIAVEITKDLSGELLEKSGNPRDVQTARGLKQVNARHQLTWTVNLPSGKEEKLTYTYQLYIRP